jgi:CHASE2 domain-containing sensor protein
MSINKAILIINKGYFTSGYSVTINSVIECRLPSNLDLEKKYKVWIDAYKKMSGDYRGNVSRDSLQNNQSSELCLTASNNLIGSFNEWLDSNLNDRFKDEIRDSFNHDRENVLIIQTNNRELWELPWHQWIKDRYHNTEVVFSHLDRQIEDRKSNVIQDIVRIISAQGNNKGIDCSSEKEILEKISKAPGTQVEFIEQETYDNLEHKVRYIQGSIFYYYGHSGTESKVWLNINNEDEKVSISQLAIAFKRSGVKIAIFNSCDNLNIALELRQNRVSIPYLILMSKKVPNDVAKTFFDSFIKEYRDGASFYEAVRIAREDLEKFEDGRYPCATWLPIIVQANVKEDAPTWNELSRYVSTKKRIGIGVGIGTLATLTIALIRFFGLLQTPELFVFDWMMRSRPSEEIDKHILVIENKVINKDDKKYENTNQSLPNKSLNELLVRIKKTGNYHIAVGLDNFFNNKEKFDLTKHSQLINDIKDGELVVVCSNGEDGNSGEPAPKIASKDSIGFADIAKDGITSEQIVRRHWVEGSLNKPECETKLSLSYQLAGRFATTHSKGTSLVDLIESKKIISDRIGPYQGYGIVGGKQLFLNYRSFVLGTIPFKVADLDEMIDRSIMDDDKFQKLIKDKVILIGTSVSKAGSLHKDEHQTPYGEMRGLYLQAHMTSQLINAIDNNRPLIWAYNVWIEFLIILGFSVSGGIIIAMVRDSSKESVCLGSAAFVLTVVPLLSAPCLLIHIGYLLPLLPIGLSLLSTEILVCLCLNHPATLRKVQNFPLPLKQPNR